MRPTALIALVVAAWLLLAPALAPAQEPDSGQRMLGPLTVRWLKDEEVVRVELLCRGQSLQWVYLTDQAEAFDLNLSGHGCQVQGQIGMLFPTPGVQRLVADLFLNPGGGQPIAHYSLILATWTKQPDTP
ncbi:MAG: hypothetical protein AB1814_13690 [Thermodesulfobacteriota bacterium]